MLEKLFDEIKGNPAIVVFSAAFIVAAFFAGLSTSKYVFEIFALEIIPKNSFISKVGLEKEYIPISKYTALQAQMQSIEQSRQELRAELDKQKNSETQAAYARSVCNRFAQEINIYTELLANTTNNIQALTSSFANFGTKSATWLASDERKADDLRQYAQQLSQQLIRLREDFSKCI